MAIFLVSQSLIFQFLGASGQRWHRIGISYGTTQHIEGKSLVKFIADAWKYNFISICGISITYYIISYFLQSEKGGTAVTTVIKKSGAENRLMEFFPSSNQQQTEENFAKSFHAKDLPEVVAFRKQVKYYTCTLDLIHKQS